MKLALLPAALITALMTSPSWAIPYTIGTELRVQPNLPKPLLGQSYTGADFGATITRITDSASALPLYDGHHYLRADYSRIQAENADGSKLLLFAANDSQLLQYAIANTDGSDLQLITLPTDNVAELYNLHDETEARWHPSNPAVIRFISGQNSYVGSLKVFEYNWQTQTVSVLADLEGKLPAKWGTGLYGMTHYEGEYSADGNRLAWSIENSKENAVGYVAFDLRDGGTVLGTKDYDGRDHNNLSISPSGRYLAISSPDSTSYFPVDFSTETLIGGEAQHGDFCVTADGGDCYITVSFDNQSDPHWGWVFSVDLDSGERTPLINVWDKGNTSMHFSGRGYDAKGWALMSTYNCHMGDPLKVATNLCSRNMLVELKENPTIINLNWNHATGENYYAEPHATMSRDAKRVYFASDWMHKNGNVDLYRVDLHADTFTGVDPYTPSPNPTPLAGVMLIAPTANTTVDSQQPQVLSFSPQESADPDTQYQLQLTNDKQGTSIIDSDFDAAEICLPQSCEVHIDAGQLQANSSYTWSVQATVAGTQTSRSQSSFKTETNKAKKPGRVSLLSPEKKATLGTDQALSFSWQAAPVANAASAVSHYNLLVTDGSKGEQVLAIEVPSSACNDGVCSISPAELSLAEHKRHTWSVQPVNTVGTGPKTKSRFGIENFDRVKPEKATLVSPLQNDTVARNTVLELSWQAPVAPNDASVATHYDLILFDRSKGKKMVQLKRIEAASVCNDSGLCSYSSKKTKVKAGKKHYWKVKAYNAKGGSKWATAKFSAE